MTCIIIMMTDFNLDYKLCHSVMLTCTAAVISNISQDFQLGFGSFVDKRVSPFVSLDTRLQENPCLGFTQSELDRCISTYSYRHHIDLTNDIEILNVS